MTAMSRNRRRKEMRRLRNIERRHDAEVAELRRMVGYYRSCWSNACRDRDALHAKLSQLLLERQSMSRSEWTALGSGLVVLGWERT